MDSLDLNLPDSLQEFRPLNYRQARYAHNTGDADLPLPDNSVDWLPLPAQDQE